MFQVELEFFFRGGRITGVPEENPSEQGREPTTNSALETLDGGRNNLETKHLFQPTYMMERIIKLMFYINNLVND